MWSAIRPSPSVQRCSVGSCETTSSPSRVACTSSSSMSVRQRSTAARNAASVFSGASSAPPRWAMCRVGRSPSRNGWRMGRQCPLFLRSAPLRCDVPRGPVRAQVPGIPVARRQGEPPERPCMSRVVTSQVSGIPEETNAGLRRWRPLRVARTIRRLIMAPPRKQKNIVKKRTYTSARLAVVRSRLPEPQRLLRVWKRVLERRLRARLRADVVGRGPRQHPHHGDLRAGPPRAGGSACTTCSSRRPRRW